MGLEKTRQLLVNELMDPFHLNVRFFYESSFKCNARILFPVTAGLHNSILLEEIILSKINWLVMIKKLDKLLYDYSDFFAAGSDANGTYNREG